MDNTDINKAFQIKLKAVYDNFVCEWHSLEPASLIGKAEEIAATKRAYNVLQDISMEKMEYLIRFVNPLEVVRDQYLDDNDLELHPLLYDEIGDAIAVIMDKRDAEQDYALDPAYMEQGNTQAFY